MRKKEKATFFIKRRKNKTYTVFSLIKRNNQTKSQPQVKDERIDSVNKALKSGKMSLKQAEAEMLLIKQSYERDNIIDLMLAPENMTLMRQYWKDYYEYKPIESKNSAKNRLQRAVNALGQFSLYSATKSQLQAQLAKTNDQRRILAVWKQLLKYIGRSDIILHAPKEKRNRPIHISLEQLPALCSQINDKEGKLLVQILFATGCRLSEAFAIRSLTNGCIFVDCQMDIKGTEKDSTKTGRERRVPVLPELVPTLRKWLKIPINERLVFRGKDWSRIIKNAAQNAFDDSIHHVSPNGLRHSYAIHLLGQGMSISQVALCLGNSVQVCQKSYVGFQLADSGLEAVIHKLKSTSK